MSNIITLSQDVYDLKKSQISDDKFLRKELSLAEFNVKDNETIIIDGTEITMNEHAFSRLMNRLRIPKAFADRFSKQFGQNGLAQLVDMMKAERGQKLVTLLVDPIHREIRDVLPQGYAAISNSSFFNFTEEFIDKYNLDIMSVGENIEGGATINCSSSNVLNQIPGMPNEVFQSGVQFRNGPSRGLEVRPFLTRLACLNGMTSRQFPENFQLHKLDERKIREFNDHMIHLATTGFRPSGIQEQIVQANTTQASLAEVNTAMSIMMKADKNISFDYLQRYVPSERSHRAYDKLGANTADFTKKQLMSAKSGMTLWDVVNGVTNFASNDTRFAIGEGVRSDMMQSAGLILTKKEFDLSGNVAIDPFANSLLLTEEERMKVRGEA